MAGVDVCRSYRAMHGSTPVVMLTGKTEVSNRVEALDVGADDYVMKPFAMPELLSRIRALLRRQPAYVGETLMAGKLQLDTVRRRVILDGIEVKLKPNEYSLLEFLCEIKTKHSRPKCYLIEYGALIPRHRLILFTFA